MRTLYKSEQEEYPEPIRTGNAFSSNYIEHESSRDKDKILSIKVYVDMIKLYLSNMISNHKTQGEWKIQLTAAINFMSSKDSNEARTMHSYSHNIETLTGSETDKIIEELFESLLKRFQERLEEKRRRK